MSSATSIRILLTVAGCVIPAAASAQSDVAQRIQRVESGLRTAISVRGSETRFDIRERMRMYGVPGVSVAVINDGRVEWARGYGVKEAGGAPVDTATLFQAASISKPVAAIAALRLVEEGRLALDEDVNARLVSWRVPQNDFTRVAPVTLERLLSHSAGLTVHGFRGYAASESVPTVVQVLNGETPANSAAVRADTLPGALWRYSGGGSTVAQLLMQDVSRRDFPALLREYVLQPANMVHSGYEQPLPAARAASAATGHRSNGAPVTGKWHTYPEMFAAGLWTTPSDLARLAIQVQRSVRGENGILSAEMARRMLTVQSGQYGLGFGIAEGDAWKAFSHGGANEGFRAFFIAYADRGQGAVVMTNSDAGGAIASEVIRAVAHEYGWPSWQTEVRDVVSVDAEALADFAGDYTLETNGRTLTLSVRLQGSELSASGPMVGPPGISLTLYPATPERFFQLQGGPEIVFGRDDAGNVTHAMLEGGGQPLRLARTRAPGS